MFCQNFSNQNYRKKYFFVKNKTMAKTAAFREVTVPYNAKYK